MPTTRRTTPEDHAAANPGDAAGLRAVAADTAALLRDNAVPIALLVALQFAVHHAFFTYFVFTNHSLPNVFVTPYPSYRTLSEGRWLADIVIWLQGGAGVAPLLMFLAAALQAANGFVLAHAAGLTRRADMVLVAALLCFHPAFLDYFSFSIDHLVFVLGDAFAVAGFVLLARGRMSIATGVAAALLFMASIATYQPKIALVALFGALAVALRARGNARAVAGVAGFVAAVLLGAVALYALSLVATLQDAFGGRLDPSDVSRNRINSLPQMLAALRDAFAGLPARYPIEFDFLPRLFAWLPAALVVAGAAALLRRAWRGGGVAALVLAALALAAVPVALRLANVINAEAWPNAGRITFVHGYALALFVAVALAAGIGRRVLLGAGAAALYFMVVMGAQESNAAAFKTTYDLNTINRIVARIEAAAPDLRSGPRPVVVLGLYPAFQRDRYVRAGRGYPPGGVPRVHARTHAFPEYRQPDILNHFVGRDAFRAPTRAEAEAASASAAGRAPWPAPDAVWLQDGTVVVLLEPVRAGMPRTWSVER